MIENFSIEKNCYDEVIGEKNCLGDKSDLDELENKYFEVINEVYINKLKKGVVMSSKELDSIEEILNEIETIFPLQNLETENSKMELFFKHITRLENQYEELMTQSSLKLTPFEK